jgi:hypothetical protein
MILRTLGTVVSVTRASRGSLHSSALSLRFAAGQGARGRQMDGGCTGRLPGFATFGRELQRPPPEKAFARLPGKALALFRPTEVQAPPASEVPPSI